jgi:hypothetical protein
MSGHVVDLGCDTLVESFVVHSLYVEQVEPGYEESLALFLIFLSNVPYAWMKTLLYMNVYELEYAKDLVNKK